MKERVCVNIFSLSVDVEFDVIFKDMYVSEGAFSFLFNTLFEP